MDASSPLSNTDFFTFFLTVDDVDAKRRTASTRMLAFPSERYSGLLGTLRLPPGIVLSVGLNGGMPDEWKVRGRVEMGASAGWRAWGLGCGWAMWRPERWLKGTPWYCL